MPTSRGATPSPRTTASSIPTGPAAPHERARHGRGAADVRLSGDFSDQRRALAADRRGPAGEGGGRADGAHARARPDGPMARPRPDLRPDLWLSLYEGIA